MSIANSRNAQALFSAAAMRPGEGVSGTVTIGNSGDVAGVFAVKASGVVDTPGPNGGLLSERVALRLFDVTDAGPPVMVYAGHPADFDGVSLGTFAPGEERDYLFSAVLPEGANNDNDYQGAGLSLGFEWRAGTASTPTPTPTADADEAQAEAQAHEAASHPDTHAGAGRHGRPCSGSRRRPSASRAASSSSSSRRRPGRRSAPRPSRSTARPRRA